MFPNTDIVHHFHPIAWVRQMKLVFGEGAACESLIWGEKFTCKERKKVIQIAENLGIGSDKIEGANWIMAVMSLETGGTFAPSITNSLGYTGLIQFGKSVAKDLKTTTKKLKDMTVIEQLVYVEKYFNKYKPKLKTITDLYLSVLYPKASGHGLEKGYVVFDDTERAYKANPAFFYEDDEVDKNSKNKIIKRHGKIGGKTYVWEVEKAIKAWYNRGLDKKNTCKIDTSTCSFSDGENQTNEGRAPWMKIAKEELGVEEIKGKKHNPKILAYHKAAGLENHKNKKGQSVKITDDKNWPWCSSFAAWVFTNTTGFSGKITAKATNWKNWGKSESIDKPMYGALAVIDWGKNDNGAGHVAFVVKVTKSHYYLLGGNQTGGDKTTNGKVCIGKYTKSAIDYVRIPSNYNPSEADYIYDEVKSISGGFESYESTR